MRPTLWAALAFVMATTTAVVPHVHAQTTLTSTIRLAHPILNPGQAQIVTVTVRDLTGRPLVAARASAQVQIGSQIHHYSMAATNRSGVTSVSIHPSRSFVNVRVFVRVSVSNGFISLPLAAQFVIRSAAVPGKSSPTATPGRTRAPARTATAVPFSPTPTPTSGSKTATPTATPVAVGQTGTAVIVPRAVPDTVSAPGPAWIVAFVHTDAGINLPGVSVQATAPFMEGSVTAVGVTDSSGVASIMIDTSEVHTTQTVVVQVKTTYASKVVSGTATLTVAGEIPTAVPSTSPVVFPTAVPTWTPLPLPTGNPVPTVTPIPTETPIPTAVLTSTPAPTPTDIPGCPGTMDACMHVELAILNNTRAQYGVPPLALNSTQSLGTASCAGSLGHSEAMQASGYIWHVNPAYPAASFPNNICVSGFTFGENVGMSSRGNEQTDLQYMQQLMMSEPHDSATCATTIDHACNIISSKFTKVGVGIYYVNGATWLTTDFIG